MIPPPETPSAIYASSKGRSLLSLICFNIQTCAIFAGLAAGGLGVALLATYYAADAGINYSHPEPGLA